MAKSKSISTLAIELQKENEALRFLRRGFNSMCKAEFSLSIDDIHAALNKLHVMEAKMANKSQPHPTSSAPLKRDVQAEPSLLRKAAPAAQMATQNQGISYKPLNI